MIKHQCNSEDKTFYFLTNIQHNFLMLVFTTRYVVAMLLFSQYTYHLDKIPNIRESVT